MVEADVQEDMYFCRILHRRTSPHTHTLSGPFRGPFRLAHPLGHILSIVIAHTGFLVHADVFFSLRQPTQLNWSTRKFSSH